MSNAPEEALQEFVSEGEEILARTASQLRQMESGVFNLDAIDSLYRDVHTLKGTSNLFGYKKMGLVAHALEASLEPCRRKKKAVSPGLLDILFQGLDLLEKFVKSIQTTKMEANLDNEIKELIPRIIEESAEAHQSNGPSFAQKVLVEESEQKVEKRKVVASVEMPQVIPKLEPTPAPLKMENPVSENSQTVSPQKTAETHASSESASTVRISVSLLDKLMNLVGEMVLVRNQVLQYSKSNTDSEFLKMSKRLDIVTSELQGEVMKTRMQPIGVVLEKYHRVVRDIQRDLGKKIEFHIVGAETELDKSLIEAVKDPLTHIVRNSCDHGIETPEERVKSGKSETGNVTVKAYHEGGQIIIEVTDDGKGLAKKRILEKAIERNLVSKEQAATLSDKEVFNFIFEAGFSTATAVTTVSGRGVGMDVVRTNIEKIGGVIELSSL